MKKHLSFIIGVCITCLSLAQTTATDFTANDCSGNSHNLFSELNQGKVIVLVWVMPCGLCISPSLTSYNVVQSYATSGCDVKMYLVDDFGNTNCTTLSNWGITNVGTNTTNFSNAAINMLDYGVAGMPKIVVVGGPTHAVYSIQNNSVNATTLQNAINQACADIAAGVKDVSQNIRGLNLYPNPVNEKAQISFTLETACTLNVEICDVLGSSIRLVKAGSFVSGEHRLELNVKELAEGIYFLRVTEGSCSRVLKFIVQK